MANACFAVSDLDSTLLCNVAQIGETRRYGCWDQDFQKSKEVENASTDLIWKCSEAVEIFADFAGLKFLDVFIVTYMKTTVRKSLLVLNCSYLLVGKSVVSADGG